MRRRSLPTTRPWRWRPTEAWLGRAVVCFALGRHDDARGAIDKALALKPHSPQAWLVRGNILSSLGSHYAALAAYDKSLALDPQMADAWRGRALVLTAQNRHPEAVTAYDKLLAIRPDAEYAQGARLLAKMQVCDWTDWTGECERILAGVRQDDRVASPSVLLVVPATASEQDRCAQADASAHHPAASPPVWRGEKYRRGKINVAYISSDFRDRPDSRLLAGLIERYDRGLLPPPYPSAPMTAARCGPASKAHSTASLMSSGRAISKLRSLSASWRSISRSI
jgi:tetratricopeptide (TPR) repeat protein